MFATDKLISKAEKVIRSCYTLEQLDVAVTYIDLVVNKCYPNTKHIRTWYEKKWLKDSLISILRERRSVIRGITNDNLFA